MNPFASHTVKLIDLPFDPPHTVTIRRLPGRHLAKAQQESQIESVENLKRLGGPAFQKELSALGTPEDQAALIAKFKADPLNGYDRYELVKRGVVAWTYEEPVTPEAIEDLVDEAIDFLAREVLRLAKPSLFQTPAEVESARGEDSGASIAP